MSKRGSILDETLCVGGATATTEGFVSLAVPTYRASTIVFDDAAAYAARATRAPDGYLYGLTGTPTTKTLEARLAALEGAARCYLAPSGQAAITVAMLATLSTGDHVLIPDAVYPPIREFAMLDLRRLGIDPEFYLPEDLDALTRRVTPRTRLVWVESPGSVSMEMQDVAAIAALAHSHGALVGCDNTWATPLNFKPLLHGADIVVEALSKYVGGHSDLLLGSIATRDEALGWKIKAQLTRLGVSVSPDEVSLALRGLETMAVRLDRSARVADKLARRFLESANVETVLLPSMPHDRGHGLWQRDYAGTSGVFTVVFTQHAASRLAGALEGLNHFAIGASWGGTHSLVAPIHLAPNRSLGPVAHAEPVLRISVGMEAESDLIADIDALLNRIEMS